MHFIACFKNWYLLLLRTGVAGSWIMNQEGFFPIFPSSSFCEDNYIHNSIFGSFYSFVFRNWGGSFLVATELND